LKDALVHVDEPEDYDLFVAMLQKLDNRMRARQAEKPRTAPAATKPKTTPTAPATPAPAHPTSSGSGYYGPAPMDLSAGRRKLTQEERLRHLTNGLCLYCGGQGHMAVNCPGKRPRPANVSGVIVEEVKEESKN
jgi:hypothetical protein